MSNDIIIIGQQPWDTDIGSNCKNIALEWSKTNRVLYINSPLDRISLIKNKKDPKIQKRINVVNKQESGLIKIQDNLWNYYPDCLVESINWINSLSLFRFFNKRNNRKLSKSIAKALEALNFQNVILFNDNEMFKAFYLADYLKPVLSIYYSRDYMIGVDYWKKHGETLEPELIAKSDLCFANSEYLATYCRKYNIRSFNVGQGCDIESFKDVNDIKPDDLNHLKGPIIGYVGVVSASRLDVDIILHIAMEYIDYQIVLVGPEDDVFRASKLHDLNNVHFLGQKEVSDLPVYINTFDICINPQVVNAITRGNYPRKIDEYLALGKPVVATRTETMEFFSDFVYLADNKEDYIKLIKLAIHEDSEERRLARKDFAFGHTWENSVQEMMNEINTLLKA
ncbi:glycosyltransferase [Pedobacter sp. ASV1-7]|uniref:glycosyltransferase n=1 Tax=Pedobacter sp. ASV1-7 TaxID=3145237 RepID=UPI0032E926AC